MSRRRRESLGEVLVRRVEESDTEHEARVAAFLRGSARARNTERAYATAWRRWEAWCGARGVSPRMPTEEQVAGYLAALVLGGLAPQTIQVYLSGLRRGLIERGCVTRPANAGSVLDLVDGLRRERIRPPRQVRPVTAALLRRCVAALPRLRTGELGLAAIRDRALLLVGCCAGLRRSELRALNWQDVTPDLRCNEPHGLVLRVQGKGEQYGAVYVGVGQATDVAMCPVRALRALYLVHPFARGSGIGAVFTRVGRARGGRLDTKTIARIVKTAVTRVGEDPSDYGGHSLRAGLVTDLAPGLEAVVGMRQTRHKSVEMWARYYRPEGALEVNYTRLAGL